MEMHGAPGEWDTLESFWHQTFPRFYLHLRYFYTMYFTERRCQNKSLKSFYFFPLSAHTPSIFLHQGITSILHVPETNSTANPPPYPPPPSPLRSLLQTNLNWNEYFQVSPTKARYSAGFPTPENLVFLDSSTDST